MTDNLMNVLGGAIIGVAAALGLSSAFLSSHDIVDDWEGGYVNHPLDRGKATHWGITKKVAAQYGYTGDMKDLPPELALEIFHEEYWVKHNLQSLADIDSTAAQIVYDQLILHGKRYGIEWLQWCANVTDHYWLTLTPLEGPHKTVLTSEAPDLKVDGKIGRNTLYKLKVLRNSEKSDRVHQCQRARQIRLMVNIVERDDSQKVFLAGWLRRAFQ